MPRQVELAAPRNVTPGSQGQIDVGLPVTAPLYVQQPRTSAQNLKDALDAFAPVAKQGVGVWEQKNAAKAGEDAASGNQDAWLFKNSPAYHRNFMQQTTQARWNLYQANLAQEVQHNVETNPLWTPQDTNKLLDQRFNEFIYGKDGKPLPGMDEASVAKGMLPQFAQARAQLVQGTATSVKANADQNFTDSVGINASAQYSKDGKIDWNAVHDSLYKQLGGPKTNAALAQMAASLAERYHDPSIIGSLPEKWSDGTPGILNTEYGVHLVRAQDTAKGLQKQDNAQAADADKAAFLKRLSDSNTAGVPVPWKALSAKDSFGNTMLSPAEQLSWYERGLGAQVDAAKRAAVDAAIARGDGSERMLVGQDGITSADIQAGVDRKVAAAPPEQQLQAAFKLAAVTNHPATMVKDFLSNPNLQNPQDFGNQLKTFATMQASNPGATYLFTDDKTAALYQSALTMQDGGMNPEQIATALSNRDPKMRTQIETTQKAVAAALSDVKMQRAWIRKYTGADVSNPGVLTADVQRTANMLVETNPGRYVSADAAIDDAAKLVSGRYLNIKLSNGESYAVHKTPDMPNTDQLRDAWNYWNKFAIPELVKGTDHKAEDVELRPDPMSQRDHDTLALYVAGTNQPVGNKRYTYQDLLTYYGAHLHADLTGDLQKVQAANKAQRDWYNSQSLPNQIQGSPLLKRP